MAIIGEIIKKAIQITGTVKSEANPVRQQHKVLSELLETAKFTAFGRKFQFEAILKSGDIVQSFQELLPIYDYDGIYADWWHYLLEGHQNITWPGGQAYFALSSGTTSKSKYIPVTDDMLEAIKRAGIQQILSLKNFDLPASFFQKQIFMLGSSTNLIKKGDHLEGEISGISAGNIPFWFKQFYKPGSEIAAIDDWHLKIKRIAENARQWDIGSITGIPSWTELMLKEILGYHEVETIHDIWPNLSVYTSGGVAFEPYRMSFEKLLKRPLVYIDTYLASEGYLATQKRPDAEGMALIVDNGVFFEFVPFTESNMTEEGAVRQEAEVLTLEDVKEGENYVLLISTVAGAWRYMIGDTVIITDKDRAEIKISGRVKHYLNVIGEQLSVDQMDQAIQRIEKEYGIEIKEYVVTAHVGVGADYTNRWLIGTDKDLDTAGLAKRLDEHLKELNKNYEVARNKALKSVEVRTVPVNHFYRWAETTKKAGGQVKIPRVMKQADFEALTAYFDSLG
ncbi:GH3 auxin-responsive promoter family protein [Olivibacter sp. XZL3]|uniref:GH3 family domain-containing protein n=1 Tax=Olivibacter sp. XZL3 TaxID=1735116 RepID=UPI0010648850|nr:GH3 auxin-responsive promoter family protein [Olivibacter sp. XZL3]